MLASAKKTTFFAGADLKGLMRHKSVDAAALFNEIEQMKRNFRTLETLGVPVVSCINGSALGGGWEVALVGHHRIAVDNPKIQLGLPEITLGLIPGATGITKMTRLLGLMGAQPYILESKLFNPKQALALGLVHELVADASELRAKALAWIAAHPTSVQPWDDKTYKMPGGTPEQPQDRRRADRGAGHVEENHARPLPCARSRAGRHGRRRAGGLRHGDPHRVALPGARSRSARWRKTWSTPSSSTWAPSAAGAAALATRRATSRRRWAFWAPA